jgi:dTDP-4-dehydrorhamnose reductase
MLIGMQSRENKLGKFSCNGNMSLKILITGSSGMLGRDMHRVLVRDNIVYGVDIVSNPEIKDSNEFLGDLTDSRFLNHVLMSVSPQIIIHCAAIVNLKQCEENRVLTNALHLDVTKQLVEYDSAKIIFISTDSVFNGERGGYKEEDIPSPLNYYGESKLLGEDIVRKNSNNLIIRTNIFGFRKPLLDSLAEWAIKSLVDNKSISGYTDIYFNGIYTKHLAEIIKILISSKVSGIYHVASVNELSKYSFLKYLHTVLIPDKNLILPKNSSGVQMFPARPKRPTLSVKKVKRIVNLPTVEEGIDNLIDDYLKEGK